MVALLWNSRFKDRSRCEIVSQHFKIYNSTMTQLSCSDCAIFTWSHYFCFMSIEVKDLLKVYGEQRAVNNISFKVDKGEIVGFLGPNGAGKSTTMKIITGYLHQDDG